MTSTACMEVMSISNGETLRILELYDIIQTRQSIIITRKNIEMVINIEFFLNEELAVLYSDEQLQNKVIGTKVKDSLGKI